MLKPRFATLSAVVLLAALWRLVPHPWNLTPVSAMALFAGAHFSSRRTAYAVPIAVMLISNLFLGGFYSTQPFVLGCFAFSVFLGTRLRNHRDVLAILGMTITSSLVFFVVTNGAHWAFAPEYPKNSEGLFACFAAGIPFFRNTVLGDLGFTAVFFGGFAWLESRFPALRDPALSRPLHLLPQ